MDNRSGNHIHSVDHSSALKFPRLPSASTRTTGSGTGTGDQLVSGRRSFTPNTYGVNSSRPTLLKLPKLQTPPIAGKANTGPRIRLNQRATLPPATTLTKQEQLNEEAANTANKKVERLNIDIDKKLSSVHHSMQSFEKKSRSVNDSMQNAVRRSLSDAVKNKVVLSKPSTIGFMDHYEQKCIGLGRHEETEKVTDETASSNDSFTQSPRNEDFRQLNSMTMASKDIEESCADDSKFDCSTSLSFLPSITMSNRIGATILQPEKLYDVDKSPQSLGPIMENLSDKAFLTKLKIKDGLASRSMQKMQNRANAIQNQLQIDKLKAKVENKSGKPLYKPRKEHLVNSTQESRQELMGFLQSKGGRTGNWNSADHAKWIKIYTTWKGIPELIIEKAILELRHKTPQEIIAHAEWYEEFESLIKSNRNEVRKWDEGKRREREIIYQMETEARKMKFEDEKRRKEHLQNIRIRERQMARFKASKWKILKTKSEASNDEKVEIDTDGLCQEMLTLAEKVQSITNPFPRTGRKLQPPHLRHVSAKVFSNRGGNTSDFGILKASEVNGVRNSAPSKKVERIKLPPLDIRNDKDGTESNCSSINYQNKNFGGGDFEYTKSVDDKSAHRKVSKLNEDTFSHKVRKEAQVIKRMEIRSLKGHVPHRVQEIQLQSLPNSIHSLHAKKGVPTWRKITS